ncbi:MAG: hypothetical protein AAGN82_21740 [Myxococcota bacterium]
MHGWLALFWAGAVALTGCSEERLLGREEGVRCSGDTELLLADGPGSEIVRLVDRSAGWTVMHAEDRRLVGVELNPDASVQRSGLGPLGTASDFGNLRGWREGNGYRFVYTERVMGDVTMYAATLADDGEGLSSPVVWALPEDNPRSLQTVVHDGRRYLAWRRNDRVAVSEVRGDELVTLGELPDVTVPPRQLASVAGMLWLLVAAEDEGTRIVRLRSDGTVVGTSVVAEADGATLVTFDGAPALVHADDPGSLVVRRVDIEGEGQGEVARLELSAAPEQWAVHAEPRAGLVAAWRDGFGDGWTSHLGDDRTWTAPAALEHEGRITDLRVRSVLGGALLTIEEDDPIRARVLRRCR